MKKIAIFTEGQTELIFLRYFLSIVFGWDKISFRCLRLYAKEVHPAPWDHLNQNAEVDFLIINACSDEKVLSAIKEREKGLIKNGYEKIIGLRDMYSDAYIKRTSSTINNKVTKEFIANYKATIQMMSYPDKIKMYFAIMEIEAWFLGMYNLFKRLDSSLVIRYIKEKLGFDLGIINPQDEFLKPSDIVDNILQLAGRQYKKSESDVERICSIMNKDDFDNAFENGRCDSFKVFFYEVLNSVTNSPSS